MTIAENIYRKWKTVNGLRVIQFRILCEKFEHKYSYKWDVPNLRFTHFYEFEDGSSLVFGTDLSEGKTQYFCEVKK